MRGGGERDGICVLYRAYFSCLYCSVRWAQTSSKHQVDTTGVMFFAKIKSSYEGQHSGNISGSHFRDTCFESQHRYTDLDFFRL